jgi:hypothetical protein
MVASEIEDKLGIICLLREVAHITQWMILQINKQIMKSTPEADQANSQTFNFQTIQGTGDMIKNNTEIPPTKSSLWKLHRTDDWLSLEWGEGTQEPTD